MNYQSADNFLNRNNHHDDNQQRGRELWHESPQNWYGNNNPNSQYQNRHHGSPNYRPDDAYRQNQHPYQQEQPAGNYGKRTQVMPGAPYDAAWRHHDNHTWSERNDFKDDDYRYRSGHRDTWHRDYDRMDNHDNEGYRRHEPGFFEAAGNKMSQFWNDMVHPDRNYELNRRHEEHPYHRHHSFGRRDDYRRYEDTQW